MKLERLMKLTDKLKLEVDRLTTGNMQAGFHTFEFSGDEVALKQARNAIADEWDGAYNLVNVRRVDNPRHVDFGKHYLCVESFWC